MNVFERLNKRFEKVFFGLNGMDIISDMRYIYGEVGIEVRLE